MNFKHKRLANTPKAIKLLDRLCLEEKVRLMSGPTKPVDLLGYSAAKGSHYNDNPYPAGGCEKIGLPPLMFCDGARGVVCGTGQNQPRFEGQNQPRFGGRNQPSCWGRN